jgi:hypothetical protein
MFKHIFKSSAVNFKIHCSDQGNEMNHLALDSFMSNLCYVCLETKFLNSET